ncbi:41249_t:CDS:1, partial [Gigaspora margarita]
VNKQKTPENEYKNLFEMRVSAYKKKDYKTSYNCFSSIANSKDSKFKYDVKFYLAKQYENGSGLSKNY